MIKKASLMLAAMPLVAGCPDPGSATITGWNGTRVDDAVTILPVAARVFDMDGDGDLDVVSAWRGALPGDGEQPGLIAIHFQQSPTSWTTAAIDSGPRYVEVNAITVADVNQDANPDVVAAAMDRIIYLSAPADPTATAAWEVFEIAASIGDDFNAWFDVAAGQIDGEGGLDIVAPLSQAEDGRLVWLRSPPDPDSEQGWELIDIDAATRSQADSVALTDLNGDNLPDVVSTAPGESADGISWYEHPPDPVAGPWTKHPISDFAGATRFALADFNGDGRVDLAAISPTDQRAAWLAQPANLTDRWGGFVFMDFTAQNDGRLPTDIVIADVEGNGQNDVVIAAADPGGAWWYTPGSNIQLTWSQHPIAILMPANAALIDVGDIDADGDADVTIPVQDEADGQDRVEWFANPTLVPG